MIVNFNPSDVAPEIPASAPKEMISVRREGSRTFVRINSSSVSVIQECLRKAKLSLHEGWRSETESPATLFGSGIHAALEVFYRGAREERILPRFEKMELLAFGGRLPDADMGNLILRATRAFLDRTEALKTLPETDKRSHMNGVYILHEYFKTWIDDPYVAHIDEKGEPYVERPFTFRLHESDGLVVDYFGTIDLVVRHVTTGEILVCDHKTSSVVGNDFYNRLKPNHQYTGYLLGAKRGLGLDATGFLVNCLQVKEKPKTSRGSAPHFPRQVTTRDEDDFNEFRDAVVTAALEYVSARRIGVWPIGPVNACATYGGCSFLSVCSAPTSMRQSIIKSKFKQRQGDENATT